MKSPLKQKGAKKRVKLTTEVSMQKVRCLIYSAYMLGFIACKDERRSLDNPNNFKEIQSLIDIISKNV